MTFTFRFQIVVIFMFCGISFYLMTIMHGQVYFIIPAYLKFTEKA